MEKIEERAFGKYWATYTLETIRDDFFSADQFVQQEERATSAAANVHMLQPESPRSVISNLYSYGYK